MNKLPDRKKLKLLGVFCALLLFSLNCSDPENDIRIQALVSTANAHTHLSNITHRQIKSGILRFVLFEINDHDHTFELKAEELALLELGIPVTVSSTENQYHSHSVTVIKQEFQN